MDKQALSQFRSSITGVAFTPEDEGYAEAKVIWNGTISKQPAIIVTCRGTDDVIKAVNFAREQGLGVSVRGGGHHVAGSSLIDGGLVVDLSQMRAVTVDPATRTVRADGGALIGDVDAATQAHGLAVPLGLVSETGIAGLTLGGGLGWMRRKYGAACDNLTGAGVVTADGRLLHASATENPDLFWALKGGGWDMGVVVSFEYQAYPLGPEVFLAFVTYPRSEGKQVLQRFRDAYAAAPPEMAPLAVGWTFPEAEAFPKELWHQQFIGVVGPYSGPVEEGEKAARPFRELGTVLTDMSGPVPWLDVQHFFDEDYPKGRRYYWKSSYLKALSDEVIDLVLELTDARPSPLSSIDIWPLGGAISGVSQEQSPMGHRDAPFAIGVECNWDAPAADEENFQFGREAIERLRPYSTGGSYMNFEDPDDAAATAASHGDALKRLQSVKRTYDPENLFQSRRGLLGSTESAAGART
jgi:FAD/FMN-containing dehydrogenase